MTERDLLIRELQDSQTALTNVHLKCATARREHSEALELVNRTASTTNQLQKVQSEAIDRRARAQLALHNHDNHGVAGANDLPQLTTAVDLTEFKRAEAERQWLLADEQHRLACQALRDHLDTKIFSLAGI